MKHLRNLSDAELIQCFYSGDAQAFDILATRYRSPIRCVVIRYVKDRFVTEDLVQDIFIRIYTSLQKRNYSEQGSFLSWCLRIARNLCLDHLRKESQEARCEINYKNSHRLFNIELASNRIEKYQFDQQLNSLVRRLPDKQREVVYYRFFDGLSFKEISNLMNASINTSLGRMHYGLAQLRKQFNHTSIGALY